jgi:hypothetical protein
MVVKGTCCPDAVAAAAAAAVCMWLLLGHCWGSSRACDGNDGTGLPDETRAWLVCLLCILTVCLSVRSLSVRGATAPDSLPPPRAPGPHTTPPRGPLPPCHFVMACFVTAGVACGCVCGRVCRLLCAFHTVCAFHGVCFPHSVCFSQCAFHTVCFSHSVLSTRRMLCVAWYGMAPASDISCCCANFQLRRDPCLHGLSRCPGSWGCCAQTLKTLHPDMCIQLRRIGCVHAASGPEEVG